MDLSSMARSATNGAPVSQQLSLERAEECRELARRTEIASVRVMLEHIAETWERIAARLTEPD